MQYPADVLRRGNAGIRKVFSELRQGLDIRRLTDKHRFDHRKSMVETDYWICAAPIARVYAAT